MAGTMRIRQKIRAPRRGLNQDNVDFDATWASLADSFRQIHSKNASKLSYEELYRYSYRIVLKKKGDQLYQKVQEFEEDWLSGTVSTGIHKLLSPVLLATRELSAGASATERREAGERFMQGLRMAWQDHILCTTMIADTLMYLDRVFCTDNNKLKILEMSLELFRDNILYSKTSSEEWETVLAVVVQSIQDQIQMERDGEVINRQNIKQCITMLSSLYADRNQSDDQQLYTLHFEPAFLDQTKQFYTREGEKLLGSLDAEAYCAEVWRRIDEEELRCQTTISESTMDKSKRIVVSELAQNRIQSLIEMESGLVFMIENSKFDGLKKLYRLNALVDSEKMDLKKALGARVIQEGEEINKSVLTQQAQPSGPGQPSAQNQLTTAALNWVEDVLALKDKYDLIWRRSFEQDQVLHASLTRSFADFINSITFSRASEFLSLFIDENMKKGIRDKTEAQVDEVLDKAIEVLKYVVDKDMFERYYKKHLSKRLLMNKSASMEVENQMISRMKLELGNSFTMKLEAMFKDMAISQGLTQGYKEYVAKLSEKDPSRIELKIDVLTSGTWPIDGVNASTDDELSSRANVVYPPVLMRVMKGFENFYSNKHSGRKLSWQPQLGTADITIRFQNKPGSARPYRQHEVNLPTAGMIVLLLFRDMSADEGYSYEDIKTMTGIGDHELKRTLQSLAVAKKTQILKKEPMSRDINSDDKFYFNEGFKSDYRRVKVGMITASNRAETESERAKTEKAMDDQRNYIVEAAIVRIMKAKKTLSHENLIVETINQLAAHFRPDIAMLKSRIETLIEREYLQRIEDAVPPAYQYLA